MCLAIYKPANVIIDEDALRNGFENNDDGAGYTIATPTGLKTYKGFFKFDQFIKHWRVNQNFAGMIHFRWATSGKQNKANCHPFRFGRNKEWAMIHNGVLHTRTTPDLSDTACFTKDVLHELAIRDMIHHPDVIEELEYEIGMGNKMVILSPTGDEIILNEEKGFWKNGVWWSNDSFEHTYFRMGGVYSGRYRSNRQWWEADDDEYNSWVQLEAHGGKTVPNSTDCSVKTIPEKNPETEDEAEAYLAYLEEKWKQGLHE